MENASKALIIAGAILLAILIITLGIGVYQNARNTVGGNNLNKQEIEAFNSQWETYVGTSKTASEIRTMVSAIIANNAAEAQSGKNRWIALSNDGTAETDILTAQPTIAMPAVANNATYTVTAGYGTNGLIVCLDWN